MSQENLDALKAGYEAFSRGDIDAAFANFADDIVWEGTNDKVPAGGTYRGLDAVKGEWLKDVAESFEEFTVTPEEFVEGGDVIVMIGEGHAKLKNGATVDGDVCHVWRFSGDKVTAAKFFGDSAAVLEAMQS
jgi:ketosteroid isomerase-like protein